MLEDVDIPLVYSVKVDLYIYLIIIHKYSGFIIFIFQISILSLVPLIVHIHVGYLI